MTLSETAMLKELYARHCIDQAIDTYIRGQDRLDPALQRSAFHDDAYVDCGVFAGGPDGYVDFAQTALRNYEFSHHLLGQKSIRIEGDVAYGEVYLFAWHRKGTGEDAMDVIIGARYVDQYEDRGDGWKIARRREIMDWGREIPAADDFFTSNLAFHFGRRDGQDFSETRDWPAK